MFRRFSGFHLKRICRREGRVSDFTSAELQNFDAGTWFNVRHPRKRCEKFPAERIPTFTQLLDFLKGYNGLLYVEMKCRESDIVPLAEAVCLAIEKSAFLRDKIKAVSCGRSRMQKDLPEVRTAALFQPR